VHLSWHVGNSGRRARHLSSCRCPRYRRLPVTRPRLIDSRFFTRARHPTPVSPSLPSSVSHGCFLRRLRRPCSLYRRFAYTRTLAAPGVASTNLIYERRRAAKDLPDESIRSKPIQRDRGLFTVATCNELYSLVPLALHLNGYKLMIRCYPLIVTRQYFIFFIFSFARIFGSCAIRSTNREDQRLVDRPKRDLASFIIRQTKTADTKRRIFLFLFILLIAYSSSLLDTLLLLRVRPKSGTQDAISEK